jgi:hypothetical protein
MLLGPANVRATRKDGRYKVKEEYNAYRVGCIIPGFHSNVYGNMRWVTSWKLPAKKMEAF